MKNWHGYIHKKNIFSKHYWKEPLDSLVTIGYCLVLYPELGILGRHYKMFQEIKLMGYRALYLSITLFQSHWNSLADDNKYVIPNFYRVKINNNISMFLISHICFIKGIYIADLAENGCLWVLQLFSNNKFGCWPWITGSVRPVPEALSWEDNWLSGRGPRGDIMACSLYQNVSTRNRHMRPE